MSKGLESLSDLRLGYCGSDEQKERAYNIIEKELKEYEEMKRIKGTTTFDKAIEDTLINACPNVAKKLKALEIIKNKLINVERLYGCMVAYPNEKTPIHYNEKIDKRYKRYMLTQEEYDLLKEVLL